MQAWELSVSFFIIATDKKCHLPKPVATQTRLSKRLYESTFSVGNWKLQRLPIKSYFNPLPCLECHSEVGISSSLFASYASKQDLHQIFRVFFVHR